MSERESERVFEENIFLGWNELAYMLEMFGA